jgi:hypothetical protein
MESYKEYQTIDHGAEYLDKLNAKKYHKPKR